MSDRIDRHHGLIVDQKTSAAAEPMLALSKGSPRDERYSLTAPAQRSSQSASIVWPWQKRRYEQPLCRTRNNRQAEAAETPGWRDVAAVHRYRNDSIAKQASECVDAIPRKIVKKSTSLMKPLSSINQGCSPDSPHVRV